MSETQIDCNFQCPECRADCDQILAPGQVAEGDFLVCGECAGLIVLVLVEGQPLSSRAASPEETARALQSPQVRLMRSFVQGYKAGKKVGRAKWN